MKNKLLLCVLLCLCLPAACGIKPAPAVTEAPVQEGVLPDIDQPVAVTEEPTPPPKEIPLYDDYQVTLEVEPEARTVKGIERINYTNRTETPLTEIVARVYSNAFSNTEKTQPYFDAYENQIFKYGMDFGYMNILHVSLDNEELDYELDDTVLTIQMDQPLQVGETALLKIQFDAYIPKIANRTGANDEAIWFGAFLPVLSVYDGEGWHTEPYYPAGDPFYLETANYTVEITTPAEYIVAGSGVKREDYLEDQKVTTFSANMTRDFAFALSPSYKIAETTTESGVTIQFYYYTDSLRVDEIMDISKRAVEYFERTVGKYPHAQLCIAETDMFVRGMEFSKIVFIDSSYLQRTTTYINVVHELGHQWFFNVVGNNQVTEAWLDEGLTMFVQEGFFYETEAELQAAMELEYNNIASIIGNVKEGAARRIASPVSVYETWTDYYQIQYMKAKMMMFSLYRMMGAEEFARFVSEYYKAYSFKLATKADFINKAQEVYGAELGTFFYEWLYGETMPELPAPR